MQFDNNYLNFKMLHLYQVNYSDIQVTKKNDPLNQQIRIPRLTPFEPPSAMKLQLHSSVQIFKELQRIRNKVHGLRKN